MLTALPHIEKRLKKRSMGVIKKVNLLSVIHQVIGEEKIRVSGEFQLLLSLQERETQLEHPQSRRRKGFALGVLSPLSTLIRTCPPAPRFRKEAHQPEHKHRAEVYSCAHC